MEEAHSHLKLLEEQLQEKRFFGGESVGFLDICGNYVAYWIIIIQEAAGANLFTESEFPNLWKWAEEFQGCPRIKENLPEKDLLLGRFRARFGTLSPSK